jgi:hypothetical protein
MSSGEYVATCVYLLLDLAGDLRVGGVGNTLAAFVLHVDGCVGVVWVW